MNKYKAGDKVELAVSVAEFTTAVSAGEWFFRKRCFDDNGVGMVKESRESGAVILWDCEGNYGGGCLVPSEVKYIKLVVGDS